MTTALDAAALRALRVSPRSPRDRMDDAEVAAQRVATPLWRNAGGSLEREFGFTDFGRTIAFVNAVAQWADAQGHHPQLLVEYGRCVVRFQTHSAGGITRNDFICAAKLDALGLDGR